MISENLHNILRELPQGVKLVAVSKFHPVSVLMEAYGAGQRVFGENRPQEFAEKVPQMPSDVEWHFIGHLQTNKLKLVLPYAALVESIDTEHLLNAVNAWGERNGKITDILLEVHIGAEDTKQGFGEGDIPQILGHAGQFAFCRFRGLMGMASHTDDAEAVADDFARIKRLFDDCRRDFPALSDFDTLSIGMSGDWRIAVEHGSTQVRIGTSIFGAREY